MRTITFYSYKGGVGRTLTVANLAKFLAQLGKRVFTVDFDLEAPGLSYKFDIERERPLPIQRGLVDVLADFCMSRRLPSSLSEHVLGIPSTGGSATAIHLLPAGAAPSEAYWKRLSGIDWHNLFYSQEPEGIPLFLELKARIEEEYSPDFLLIDARTGITEMGGVATTVLAEQVVCLTLNTRETLEGTRAVMRAIRSASRLEGMPGVELVAVLSRVPREQDAGATESEAGRVLQFLNEPAEQLDATLAVDEVFTLHREPLLEERERILIGSSLGFGDSPLLLDYVRLFTRIIPASVIQETIGTILRDTLLRAYIEPEEAEKTLEDLLKSFPHADVYRALLQFYRLRRGELRKLLQTAYDLWRITRDDNDPLLWDVVRRYRFRPFDRDLRQLASVDEWYPVKFVEHIWRSNGANDERVAVELAESYLLIDEPSRARSVLDAQIARAPGPTAVAALVDLLRNTGDIETAEFVVEDFKRAAAMLDSPRFLEAWACVALERGPVSEIRGIVESGELNVSVLAKHRPGLAARLRYCSGDQESAELYLRSVMKSALRLVARRELVDAGVLAIELGQSTDFANRLKKELPTSASGILQDAESVPVPPPDAEEPGEQAGSAEDNSS